MKVHLQLQPLALSVENAAKACDLSKWTLSREISAGKLRKTSRGVIPVAEIQRYLASELKEAAK